MCSRWGFEARSHLKVDAVEESLHPAGKGINGQLWDAQ